MNKVEESSNSNSSLSLLVIDKDMSESTSISARLIALVSSEVGTLTSVAMISSVRAVINGPTLGSDILAGVFWLNLAVMAFAAGGDVDLATGAAAAAPWGGKKVLRSVRRTH